MTMAILIRAIHGMPLSLIIILKQEIVGFSLWNHIYNTDEGPHFIIGQNPEGPWSSTSEREEVPSHNTSHP